jgi:uncharacterized protein YjiK
MKNIIFTLLIAVLIQILYSCQNASNGQQQSNQQTAISVNFEYDLANSKKYDLSSNLDEISGITFHPDNSNLLYAIQDEDGKVFTYDLATEKVVDEFTFGKNGDYEGIATDGKYIYVLRSDGDIYYIPFEHNRDKNSVKIIKNVVPKGEYESLAYQAQDNSLLILCKECKVDKSKATLTGYKFGVLPDGSLNTPSSFAIDLQQLKSLDNTLSTQLKPAAITYNQHSKEWYILSSIDKVLIVADLDFHIKKVIPFKRSQFEQPEGMAISKEGHLYISSEMGNTSSASLYKFQMQK